MTTLLPKRVRILIYANINSVSNYQKYLDLDMLFFFFQAEDGIRDHCVTGVQTCALPISSHHGRVRRVAHAVESRRRPRGQNRAQLSYKHASCSRAILPTLPGTLNAPPYAGDRKSVV